MKRYLTMTALAAVTTFAATAMPAQAQDSVYVPLLTYRTGPFAIGDNLCPPEPRRRSAGIPPQ